MKNFKSVLAMIMAVCMMMCLAVPALATTTEPVLTATAPAEATESVLDTEPEGTGDVEVEVEPEEELLPEEEEALPEEEDALPEETEDEIVVDNGAEEKGPSVLYTILLILEVITSVLLILVVLIQSGKQAGLSGALSGNSDSYMNKSGKGGLDKKLARATKWIALVWILLTLALVLIP